MPRASDLWVQASLDYKQRLQQLFFPEGIAFDGNRFSDRWRESIVHPMPYAVRPRFSTLAGLAHEVGERRGREWEADVSDAVEMIAGLTAVDGATVITDQYELIAFGVKIAPRDGHRRVEQVTVTESIEDAVSVILHPTQLGGTRHFSAVRFVNEQRHARGRARRFAEAGFVVFACDMYGEGITSRDAIVSSAAFGAFSGEIFE